MSATTRNCCVLFADVAGSTRLYEQLGDSEALRAVDRCLNRVERAVVSCGGKVVKTIGDELMATFVTAEMAAHAAAIMQARINDLPAVLGSKLAIRIAFHYGSVLVDGGDIFGNTVNIASRITEVSGPREIITSAETALLLPKATQKKLVRPREPIKIKGKSVPLEIVELIWQKEGAEAEKAQGKTDQMLDAGALSAVEAPKEKEPATKGALKDSAAKAADKSGAEKSGKETAAKGNTEKPAVKVTVDKPSVDKSAKQTNDKTKAAGLRVVLRYGEQKILLRGDAAIVTLGRDQINDIVIRDPRASRSHAVIELRNGECVLVDKSSNGTFVLSKDKGDFALRKEEVTLQGRGRICFGHLAASTASSEVLEFEIQFAPNKKNGAAELG